MFRLRSGIISPLCSRFRSLALMSSGLHTTNTLKVLRTLKARGPRCCALPNLAHMCGVPCVISDGPNAVSFMANELNKIGTYTFLCKTCVGTFVAFKKSGEPHAREKGGHMFSHLGDHKKGEIPAAPKGDVHPAILALGRKYASGEVTGATARSVGMLVAFKHVVADYTTPPDKMLSWDLDKKLRPMMQYLIDCRPHSVGMGNAYKALRNVIAKSPPSLPEAAAKATIIDKINDFIQTRITLAATEIRKNAITKIREGDVILTFGRSSLVESILMSAQNVKQGSFRVIVVDSRPGLEGRQMAKILSSQGIPCTYVLLTAISYIMTEVTKVYMGASAMMSNGAVLSRAGTAVVAMMARSHNLPVMFCCETYKFCERVQLDSFVFNELGNPDDLLSGGNATEDDINNLSRLELLNVRYDLTPIKYVTLVITEFGFLPPTSVPVLIREMTRKEDKDDKY